MVYDLLVKLSNLAISYNNIVIKKRITVEYSTLNIPNQHSDIL